MFFQALIRSYTHSYIICIYTYTHLGTGKKQELKEEVKRWLLVSMFMRCVSLVGDAKGLSGRLCSSLLPKNPN